MAFNLRFRVLSGVGGVDLRHMILSRLYNVEYWYFEMVPKYHTFSLAD